MLIVGWKDQAKKTWDKAIHFPLIIAKIIDLIRHDKILIKTSHEFLVKNNYGISLSKFSADYTKLSWRLQHLRNTHLSKLIDTLYSLSVSPENKGLAGSDTVPLR